MRSKADTHSEEAERAVTADRSNVSTRLSQTTIFSTKTGLRQFSIGVEAAAVQFAQALMTPRSQFGEDPPLRSPACIVNGRIWSRNCAKPDS